MKQVEADTSRCLNMDEMFKIVSNLSSNDVALDVILESKKSSLVKMKFVDNKLQITPGNMNTINKAGE